MDKIKLGAIQLQTTDQLETNLAEAGTLIEQAAKAGAQLIVLPEMFPIGGYLETKLKVKEPLGQGPIQDFLASQAKKQGVWIVGGTFPLAIPHSSKVHAACLVFNDQGELAGRYDKIHLFDVEVNGRLYRESEAIEAGKEVTVLDTPFGRLGIAVCYDLRFPELFRCLFNQGVDIIALPAAFTPETGKAHWELLCRCRALENQAYLLAAAQTGGFTDKKTYGHSMLVNPWGEIVAELDSQPGILVQEVDVELLQKIRMNMPVKTHQKIFNTRTLKL